MCMYIGQDILLSENSFRILYLWSHFNKNNVRQTPSLSPTHVFCTQEHSLEDFIMFISEVRGQGMGEVGATVESACTFPCISEMLD